MHRLPEQSLDEYQVKVLMPLKRKLDDAYMQEATFLSDLSLMIQTVLSKGDLIEESQLFRFQQSLMALSSAVAEPEPAPAISSSLFSSDRLVS